MSYQPPALPSREKQNSQMKTECQTPRKAFQCPLPRRGSHYNGAWTSAMSPGRGEAISFHLTQFAGPRRRLMSRQHPRSQIPLSKSSYQIGLKTASKGPGGLFPTRHPAGHMATVPAAGTVLSTGDRGNELVRWSLFWGPPSPPTPDPPEWKPGHDKNHETVMAESSKSRNTQSRRRKKKFPHLAAPSALPGKSPR